MRYPKNPPDKLILDKLVHIGDPIGGDHVVWIDNPLQEFTLAIGGKYLNRKYAEVCAVDIKRNILAIIRAAREEGRKQGLEIAAELCSRRAEYYGYESDQPKPENARFAERCMVEFDALEKEILALKGDVTNSEIK